MKMTPKWNEICVIQAGCGSTEKQQFIPIRGQEKKKKKRAEGEFHQKGLA